MAGVVAATLADIGQGCLPIATVHTLAGSSSPIPFLTPLGHQSPTAAGLGRGAPETRYAE